MSVDQHRHGSRGRGHLHDPGYGELAAILQEHNEASDRTSNALLGALTKLIHPRKRKYERLTVLLDGTGAGYVETRPREGFEWFIERAYVRAGAGTVEVFIGGPGFGSPGIGVTGVANTAPEDAVDNFVANKGTPNNSAPYYVRDSQPIGFQVTGGTAGSTALITLQVREEEVK